MENLAILKGKLEYLEKYKTVGVSEIMINQPGEVWVDDTGELKRIDDKQITEDLIKKICVNLSGISRSQLSEKKPLLSTTIPKIDGRGGERVQIVQEPAVKKGNTAITIRIPSNTHFSYDQYQENGAFNSIKDETTDGKLIQLYKEKDWYGFIKRAVLTRKNIINAGGVSTGKTTFTNALIGLIPQNQRIITIEDTRELIVPHSNKVHLLTRREQTDPHGNVIVPEISATDLLASALRMRPDRIITGELRGEEAYAFLRGVNTGHPGSISTIHADSADKALDQLALLVMQAKMGWSKPEIMDYVKSVIDIVVQWKRYKNHRYISEIKWIKKD
ncbi:P-type DNA transfer ATPase VirB11 [Marinicella sp. W31]|uniref:P-type DNA transfer ATPase VirB11 n=1 Tax=Marinicella sp. W31 TaxID=3023713 RepID=UPI0037578432